MNTSINTTGNNRFKKMRKQLILIVMFITLGIFLMVFGIVVAVLTVHYDNHSKNIVSLIEQYDGILPTPGEYKAEGIIPGYSMDFRLSVEDFRTIKYYSVSFDNNGQMNCINQNISDLESLMLPKLIEKIYSIDQEYGYFEGYYFHKNYSNNKYLITLLDCAQYEQTKLMVTEILGGVLVIIAFWVTVIFAKVSKKIIRPFEENSKLQRQFITDASHELKTPLAIISANAEVLSIKNGENKWLSNIISQSKHMSSLIDDLLTLAKSDEIDDEYVFESFNLSETALNILPSYSESILSRGIRLQNNIQPNIIFNGNREMIEKLITILMDNAIKYTKENGEIILSIAQNGSKINMDFYNTADISEDYDLNNLFNRFYRPDNSRNSSTGGHGIGLSIAKKIVKNHGGMIIAQKKDNGIFFSTSFRNR